MNSFPRRNKTPILRKMKISGKVLDFPPTAVNRFAYARFFTSGIKKKRFIFLGSWRVSYSFTRDNRRRRFALEVRTAPSEQVLLNGNISAENRLVGKLLFFLFSFTKITPSANFRLILPLVEFIRLSWGVFSQMVKENVEKNR